MFKSDYANSFFVGGLVALFAVPTLYLANIPATIFLAIGGFIVFPFGAALGFAVFSYGAKKLPVLKQFAKFLIVGFSNFAIDSGVLSVVSLLTGITKGSGLAPANIPGFVVAFFNSYYWNKHWTFSDSSEKQSHHDVVTFFGVTIMGFLINTGTIYLMTTHVSPLGGLSEERWLVASQLVATVLNLVWNFLGLKFVVFTKKQSWPTGGPGTEPSAPANI